MEIQDFNTICVKLNQENFYVQNFTFTKVKLKKVGNKVKLDHRWRFSGLILVIVSFFLIVFLSFFIINILIEFGGIVISNNGKADEYILLGCLILLVFFGFSLMSYIDKSQKFKSNLFNNIDVFHDNGLYITND